MNKQTSVGSSRGLMGFFACLVTRLLNSLLFPPRSGLS